MIEIRQANANDISDIQAVANEAWPQAFAQILVPQQIVYMMEMMYSRDALWEQMVVNGHMFYIAYEDETPIGFISIEHNCNNTGKTKIHKAYIIPQCQRIGIGKVMFDKAIEQAKGANSSDLFLNVNKYNEKAIAFYNKNGFEIVKEEVIDIGNGFVMDDYVFEKKL